MSNEIPRQSSRARVGCPKEIKSKENRVALTPVGVRQLVRQGISVLIEAGAGFGAAYSNEEYLASGAEIVELSLIHISEPTRPY